MHQLYTSRVISMDEEIEEISATLQNLKSKKFLCYWSLEIGGQLNSLQSNSNDTFCLTGLVIGWVNIIATLYHLMTCLDTFMHLESISCEELLNGETTKNCGLARACKNRLSFRAKLYDFTSSSYKINPLLWFDISRCIFLCFYFKHYWDQDGERMNLL